MNAVKNYNLPSGKKLEIFLDGCPESPREWDNLGTIIAYGRDYRHWTETKEYADMDFQELAESIEKAGGIIFPIWGYEHSGLSIKTGERNYPFTDYFDAGLFGAIFCTDERLGKEYGNDTEAKEKAKKVLTGEVEVLNQYFNGDVYGYVLSDIADESGIMDEVDSCWGFYGADITVNGILEAVDINAADIAYIKEHV